MMKRDVLARATRAAGQVVSGKRLKNFRDDERGVFIVLALILVIMTYIAIGFAVDMARHEAVRARIQSTLDRSVLAAAALSNKADDVLVVKDYFTKAGYDPAIVDVTPTILLGKSKVAAYAKYPMRTMFMGWSGVPVLPAIANGAAQESIGNMEISLVLDHSGSMGREGRMAALKTGAKAFTKKLFPATAPAQSDIFLSIVPYSQSVNVGPQIMSTLNVTNENTTKYCIDFLDSDFTDTTATGGTDGIAFPAGKVWQRSGSLEYLSYSNRAFDISHTYFDQGQGSNVTPTSLLSEYAIAFANPTQATGRNAATGLNWVNTGLDDVSIGMSGCETGSAYAIAPFLTDWTRMNAVIDGLGTTSYTATDIGAKWGLALLDPSMQEEVTAWADDVADTAANLSISRNVPDNINADVDPAKDHPSPYTYNQPGVQGGDMTTKILILMTDGDHTYTNQLMGAFHSTNAADAISWVWATPDWKYVYFEMPETASKLGDGDGATNEKFYRWRENNSYTITLANRWIPAASGKPSPLPSGMVKVSWQQVFERYRAQFIGYAIAEMLATNGAVPNANQIQGRYTQLVGANTGVSIAGADATQYYIRSERVDPTLPGLPGMTRLYADPVSVSAGKTPITISPQLVSLDDAASVAAGLTTKIPHGLIDNIGTVPKDVNLLSICDLAKKPAKQVIIYTIGFKTSNRADGILRQCASTFTTPNPDGTTTTTTLAYEPSTDAELLAAFNDIADTISKLALTQ